MVKIGSQSYKNYKESQAVSRQIYKETKCRSKTEECWSRKKNESLEQVLECSSKHWLGKMARDIKQLVCWQGCSCHGNGDASLCWLHALKHILVNSLGTRWQAREGSLWLYLASSVQLPTGSSYTVSILISRHHSHTSFEKIKTKHKTKHSIFFTSLLNVVSRKFPLETHAH